MTTKLSRRRSARQARQGQYLWTAEDVARIYENAKLFHVKIWLDDERPAPDDSWTKCRWPEEVIEHLETNGVEQVSLDHDLGDDERTGYRVLTWIEEAVATRGFIPPRIAIHSANASARLRMQAAVESIERLNHNRRHGQGCRTVNAG